jgi:hypothetical protein
MNLCTRFASFCTFLLCFSVVRSTFLRYSHVHSHTVSWDRTPYFFANSCAFRQSFFCTYPLVTLRKFVMWSPASWKIAVLGFLQPAAGVWKCSMQPLNSTVLCSLAM